MFPMISHTGTPDGIPGRRQVIPIWILYALIATHPYMAPCPNMPTHSWLSHWCSYMTLWFYKFSRSRNWFSARDGFLPYPLWDRARSYHQRVPSGHLRPLISHVPYTGSGIPCIFWWYWAQKQYIIIRYSHPFWRSYGPIQRFYTTIFATSDSIIPSLLVFRSLEVLWYHHEGLWCPLEALQI